MPLNLKEKLTNSFQKLKDSTTLDERAASLLKPISNTFKPANLQAYRQNLSLPNISNTFSNFGSKLDFNLRSLPQNPVSSYYEGKIRQPYMQAKQMETSTNPWERRVFGPLSAAYAGFSATPAGVGMNLFENTASSLLQTARQSDSSQPAFGGAKNLYQSFNRNLADMGTGVGTTGLGMQGTTGMVADMLLDPDSLAVNAPKLAKITGADNLLKAASKRSPKVVMQDTDLSDLLNIQRYLNKNKPSVDDIGIIEKEVNRIYNAVKNQLPEIHRGKRLMNDQLRVLLPYALENQRYRRSGAVTNLTSNLVGDAQPTKGDIRLYRGGTEFDPSRGGNRGISLTTDPKRAEFFTKSTQGPIGETGRVVQELKLDPKAKIATVDDLPESVMDKFRSGDFDDTDVAQWVKNKGYDAFDMRGMPGSIIQADQEIRVFNGKMLEVVNPNLSQPTKGDIEQISSVGDILKSNRKVGSSLDTGPKPPSGMKERKFIETVREAESTAEPVAKKVKGYYEPIGNKKTVAEAQSYIDTLGWDKAKQKVLTEDLSRESNAIGLELMRRAQDAGRYDEAIEVAEALAEKGTRAGQAVQAFAIWGRMTPEGMTRYAVKQIEKAKADMGAVTKLVRDLTGKKPGDIKLTMEDSKKIANLMKKANEAGSEKQRMEYTKQALEVINNRIPYGVSDLVDEMRYNNMLSNPKSHLRNFYQNALNTLVTRPATLITEGKPVEAAKYYGGVLTGLPEATNKALKTIAGEIEIQKPDLKEVRQGKLPAFWQAPTRVLEAGDQFFTALIKNGMESAGMSAEDAAKAAEYSLLRTEVGTKGQGKLLESMDGISKWLYKAPKPVRWFVPFVRTPMNAAKQWIEFSPAGLATIPGAANKREQLAKTMVGSAALLMGAKLAGEDRVTWSSPSDPKEKQLFYASGRKPFSIKVGEKWVPLYYAGPFAAAMALPAAVKHYQDENRTALTDSQLDKITNISADMLKFVMGQTPLTGLNTFVKLAEGDIDYSVPRNLGFTASQLVPFTGMLNYIADVLDPIYRKPKGFVESIKAGIPGMTEELQPYREPTGEPSTRLPSNYALPYDLGQANPAYEAPYRMRQQELQQNAVLNQFKKQISDQVDADPTGATSAFQPTDKLGQSLAGLKESQEQKERYTRSREFMQFYNQNPQAVMQSIQQLGIDPNDAVFDYVANQSVDARTPFVNSMIEGVSDRKQMMAILAGMRKEVNGNKLLSDGVIDNLYDEGVIGPNEKRMLKNLEFDKEGNIKRESGGGKKIKVPSLVSTSQLLSAFNNYIKAKTAMPKSSPSRTLSDLYAKRRQRVQNLVR